ISLSGGDQACAWSDAPVASQPWHAQFVSSPRRAAPDKHPSASPPTESVTPKNRPAHFGNRLTSKSSRDFLALTEMASRTRSSRGPIRLRVEKGFPHAERGLWHFHGDRCFARLSPFAGRVQSRRRSQTGVATGLGENDQSRGGGGRGNNLHDRGLRAGFPRCFSKEISENQGDLRNRAGTRAESARDERTARREIRRGSLYLRQHLALHCFLSRKDSRADQAASDLAGSYGSCRLVRRQAALRRSRGALYFCFRRHAAQRRDYLQHQARQSGGDQIVLGSAESQVEGQNRVGRSAGPRADQRSAYFFLSTDRSRCRIFAPPPRRDRHRYRALQ